MSVRTTGSHSTVLARTPTGISATPKLQTPDHLPMWSTSGTSKSAISRRFVATTERALAELMNADLTELDMVALMIDGVHLAEHTCVVALGIGIDGTKHPLGVVEDRRRTPPW